MELLKAQKTDLPEILKLQKLCYQENAERYNDYNLPPITQSLENFEKEALDCVILKATDQSKIIGSIRAYEKDGTCYIGRLIVHPDFQNKGIGKKLMDEIESYFKEIGRFELFTGFRDEKNLYFYDKLGYKEFKREQINNVITLVYLEK